MRPVGTATVDSTVADFNNAGDYGGNDGGGKAPAGGLEMVGEREGAEEFYDGGAEVSSQCCGGLSPTTIVYMSAFVSSLTSVLLGYGESACVCVRRAGRGRRWCAYDKKECTPFGTTAVSGKGERSVGHISHPTCVQHAIAGGTINTVSHLDRPSALRRPLA